MGPQMTQQVRQIGLNHPVECIAACAGALVAFLCLDAGEAALATGWWFLVVIVVRSDIDHFLIPDWASLGIASLALVNAVMSVATTGGSTEDGLWSIAAASIGGLCAAAILWAIGRIFLITARREGLGFGDVKLAGASAMWLGVQEQAIALQFAALAAMALILLNRSAEARRAAIPFGAFLAPAAWLVHVGVALLPGQAGGPL